MTYILGVDAGSTVTKAVLFDESGREVTSASSRIRLATPQAQWVERDMVEVARASLEAVKAVVAALPSGTPKDIAAIGFTGHGDGLYMVAADGTPTRPAILSLDSRAQGIVDNWNRRGVDAGALKLCGQPPFAPGAATLLAWLRDNEPEVIAQSAYALSCKDYLKLVFTGTASTDLTDASCSFTNVHTQDYDRAVLELYGITELEGLLPPIIPSTDIAGTVSRAIAIETGLLEGTPVVSGLHDVDACSIGTGGIREGAMTVIAGTYSINEIISSAPVTDSNWLCRSFVHPGAWMSMAVSPTSATNLEWFTTNLSSVRLEGHEDPFAVLNQELSAIADQRSDLLYLPFLYGSPFSTSASAGFVGMRAWHTRGHLVRAVLEGVTHTHRFHIERLRDAHEPRTITLTGGGARSSAWSQMFADALNQPVNVTDSQESGALGAAICAGVGAGVFPDLSAGVDAAVRLARRHDPSDEGRDRMDEGYKTFMLAVDALEPVWAELGNQES